MYTQIETHTHIQTHIDSRRNGRIRYGEGREGRPRNSTNGSLFEVLPLYADDH